MNREIPFAGCGNDDRLGLWIEVAVLSAIQTDALNPIALRNAQTEMNRGGKGRGG